MKELNFKTFIAIDPGRSAGGIVLEKSKRVSVFKMPDSIGRLDQFLKENIEEPETTLCFIERVQMWHSDTDQGGKQFMIQKMLAHFQQLKDVMELNHIHYVLVSPQSWQKGLNLKIKGLDEEKAVRKKRYRDAAQGFYPSIKVSLWNSDALLLHRFLKWQMEFNPQWIWERMPYYLENKMF